MGTQDIGGPKLGKRALPVVIAAATFLAFLPALHAGFVAWDDDKNFLANPHYRGLGLTQLAWMWTTFHLGHYVPLTWMTLGLDYVLWGMKPAGYHFTNLLLHTANGIVLYFIARRVLRLAGVPDGDAGRQSAAVPAAWAALFFAIHPLRVESVAWVTERRDVLSGFFFLLSVVLYLRACDQHERRWLWYSAGLVAFVCALLSKATSMTIPAVLLILNVYPLRRIGGRVGWWNDAARRVYPELVPYGVLAAAAAFLSIVALHPPPQLSAPAKVAVSAYGLVFYLWKTIAPVQLSPIYEMPQHVDPGAAKFVLSYVLAIALLFAAWAVRHRWPGVTAAFLAFVAIMLPMLGVVQNGPQIAADRYTYHAAPALAILAGAAYARFAISRKLAVARRIAFAATLGVLGILTWRQTRVWHDSTALWSHVLNVDDESATGHVGLANVLFKQNRVDEAIEHAQRAVAIAPGYAQAHNDLGVGLALQGRHEDAIEQYELALAIEPKNDEARSNWGVAMARRGDLDGAIAQYRSALTANPDNADAHVNWGNALVRSKRPDEAIEHYREALRIRPDHADAEHNWGVALAREGKLADAIEHFRQALALDPTHAEARDYLERALQMLRGASRTSGRDESAPP